MEGWGGPSSGTTEASPPICPAARVDQPSTRPIQSRAQGPRNPKAISGGLVHLLSDLFCPLPVQPPDSVGEQPQAAFHHLPKADAPFSNSSALFFSFPVFIYLLLVLKTKVVFLFNALEMGGWMGEGAVRVQNRITWTLGVLAGRVCPRGVCSAC